MNDPNNHGTLEAIQFLKDTNGLLQNNASFLAIKTRNRTEKIEEEMKEIKDLENLERKKKEIETIEKAFSQSLKSGRNIVKRLQEIMNMEIDTKITDQAKESVRKGEISLKELESLSDYFSNRYQTALSKKQQEFSMV